MKPAPLAQCLVLILVPYGEGRDARILWPSSLRLFDKAYTTRGIRTPLEQGMANCAEKHSKVAVAENVAQLKFLYAVLVDNRPTEIWLGIHKEAGNDTWTELTTGLPAPYLPAKGLPSPRDTPPDARVCAFLNVSRGAWLMSAHSCVAMFHVVCETDCSPKDSCTNIDNYCDSAVGSEYICNVKRVHELGQRDHVIWAVGITVVVLVVIANVYTGLTQWRKRRRKHVEREELKRVAMAKLAAQRRISDDDEDEDDENEKAKETIVEVDVVEPPPVKSFWGGFLSIFTGRQGDAKVKVPQASRNVMTPRDNQAGTNDVIGSASSSRGSSAENPSGRPPGENPLGRKSGGGPSGRSGGPLGRSLSRNQLGRSLSRNQLGRQSGGGPSGRQSGGSLQWASSRSRKDWRTLKMAVFYGPSKKAQSARQWSTYRPYSQVRQQSNIGGYRKSTQKPSDQVNFGGDRKSTQKPSDQVNFGGDRKSTQKPLDQLNMISE